MSITSAIENVELVAEYTKDYCERLLGDDGNVNEVLQEAASALRDVTISQVAAEPSEDAPLWLDALNRALHFLGEDTLAFQYGDFGFELFVQNTEESEEEIEEFTNGLADALEALSWENFEAVDDSSDAQPDDSQNKLQRPEKRLVLFTAVAIVFPVFCLFSLCGLSAINAPDFFQSVMFYGLVGSPMAFVILFCMAVRNFFSLIWQNITFAGWKRYTVTVMSGLLNAVFAVMLPVILIVVFVGSALTNAMH